MATRVRTFLGAVAVEPHRVAELKPILRKPVFREPGTFGFISQPSIFGRGIGGGRKIDLDISGNDLETVLQVSGRAFGRRKLAPVISPGKTVEGLLGGIVSVVIFAVATALWAPLVPMLRGELDTVRPYRHEGRDLKLPAYQVGPHVVWGLTHRMLQLLFDVIR